jgi:hypothetical protein
MGTGQRLTILDYKNVARQDERRESLVPRNDAAYSSATASLLVRVLTDGTLTPLRRTSV